MLVFSGCCDHIGFELIGGIVHRSLAPTGGDEILVGQRIGYRDSERMIAVKILHKLIFGLNLNYLRMKKRL